MKPTKVKGTRLDDAPRSLLTYMSSWSWLPAHRVDAASVAVVVGVATLVVLDETRLAVLVGLAPVVAVVPAARLAVAAVGLAAVPAGPVPAAVVRGVPDVDVVDVDVGVAVPVDGVTALVPAVATVVVAVVVAAVGAALAAPPHVVAAVGTLRVVAGMLGDRSGRDGDDRRDGRGGTVGGRAGAGSGGGEAENGQCRRHDANGPFRERAHDWSSRCGVGYVSSW